MHPRLLVGWGTRVPLVAMSHKGASPAMKMPLQRQNQPISGLMRVMSFIFSCSDAACVFIRRSLLLRQTPSRSQAFIYSGCLARYTFDKRVCLPTVQLPQEAGPCHLGADLSFGKLLPAASPRLLSLFLPIGQFGFSDTVETRHATGYTVRASSVGVARPVELKTGETEADRGSECRIGQHTAVGQQQDEYRPPTRHTAVPALSLL